MTDEDGLPAEDPQQPTPWIVPHEYEVGASRWLNRAIDALKVSLHPLLASFGRETVRDLPEPESSANQLSKQSDPNEDSSAAAIEVSELTSPLFRSVYITHEWIMSVREAIEFDVEALLQRVYEVADEFGGKLILAMFQHISDICEKNGQVAASADGNFFDSLIDMIEKMDINFDENGNPTTQIVMNPSTLAEISKIPPTPEQEERLRIATEHKREAWLAARRRRELPEISE